MQDEFGVSGHRKWKQFKTKKPLPYEKEAVLLFAHAPGGVCIEQSSCCQRPKEEGGFRRRHCCSPISLFQSRFSRASLGEEFFP